MKFIKALFIVIISSFLLNAQSSLERQLKELNELRAKLNDLKTSEIKESSEKGINKIDVWSFIQSSWDSKLEGEDWVNKFCSDEISYWNSELPMPHDIESLTKTLSYKINSTKILFYDINEIKIIVKPEFALVFYFYNSETLDATGKIEKIQKKISDAVVLDNNNLKILSRVESYLKVIDY